MSTNIYIEEEKNNLSEGAWNLLKRSLYHWKKIDISKLTVDKNAYGKPFFKERKDIYFNLSHSNERIMCILSDFECGCDVEYIRNIDKRVLRHVFNESEYMKHKSILESDNYKELFFKAWNLKESYMKFTGRGFNLPMKSFEIDMDSMTVSGENVFLGQILVEEGYVYSYCLDHEDDVKVYVDL